MVEADLRSAMVVFPEVPSVLAELRRRGLAIGVCSNWNWDLDDVLRSTGVAPLIDLAVTSADASATASRIEPFMSAFSPPWA